MCRKNTKKGNLSLKKTSGQMKNPPKKPQKLNPKRFLVSLILFVCNGSDIHDSFIMYRDWIATQSIEAQKLDRNQSNLPFILI